MNKRRAKISLKKIYLSLSATYWSPLLWPSALCLPRSLALLNRRPEAHSSGCRLSLPHLVSYSSDLQLNWRIQGPLLPCGGFPYHIFSPNRLSSNSWLPVPTEFAHSVFGMACWIVIKRKYLSCSSQVTLFRCISLWVYHGIFS